jgi:PilZ domain-containing protein
MFPVVFATLIFGIVLTVVLRRAGNSDALRISEESAHSVALKKRRRARREPRYRFHHSAYVSILGAAPSTTACRILNVSRSGMRIATQEKFPRGIQIQVQWDDEFFIGSVRYALDNGEESITGLELVACSYTRVPRQFFPIVGWLRSVFHSPVDNKYSLHSRGAS